MEPFAILMMLGVRVREVRDLAEGAVWVPSIRLLVVDAFMSPADREATCRRILGQIQE